MVETLRRNPERITNEGYTLENAKLEYGKAAHSGDANQMLEKLRGSHEEKENKFGNIVAITSEFRKMLRGQGEYNLTDFQAGALSIDKKIGWSDKVRYPDWP